MAIDHLFEQEKGQQTLRPGTVVGLTKSRIHVQLDEPAVDLKVYTQDLPGALQLSEGLAAAYDASGERALTLGDRVKVHAAGRDGRRWKLQIRT